jgi:uncharacterized membrane protein
VTLTNAGESRVRGYLYVLERSLRMGLPKDVTKDAVREIESHLRARIAAVTVTTNERATLEQILAELGPPLRVAQAYSTERTLDEAVMTGQLLPMMRAVAHLAATTAPAGGNWVILIGIAGGLTLLVLSHRGARAFLAWWRKRRTEGFSSHLAGVPVD